MGQEISTDRFSEDDFNRFRLNLQQETERLSEWFASPASQFSDSPTLVGGFELEACLIDRNFDPKGINQSFLSHLASDLVVEELASFNVEINTQPQPLAAKGLSLMQAGLDRTWQHCTAAAENLDAHLLSIGILPTLGPEHLTLDNMSDRARYRVLNQRLIQQRRDRHIHIKIADPHDERSWFNFDSSNIMIEAAATSFQIHLQVPLTAALRYFNAATLLAGPMVAISANSPYLFGHNLWCESRIPLFEQIMTLDNPVEQGKATSRVFLSQGYLKQSMMECFVENLEQFSILLPESLPVGDRFNHLRLHNGTIWRWNRPLIGFNPDGTPHLRIEHRVVPAPTTPIDAIATAAFYFGLVHFFATQDVPPESQLPFKQTEANFYAAAQQGLTAPVTWLEGNTSSMQDLLLRGLLPMARQGLVTLQLDRSDIDFYLGIIQERLISGQTGAEWQRRFVEGRSADMRSLLSAYLDNQISGLPVHQWNT